MLNKTKSPYNQGLVLGKKIAIITAVLLVSITANTQIIFEKTYGGTNIDYGYSVQQTNDNGYIIVGDGFGNADVYLIKTDINGDTLWTKTYGGTNYDHGNSVRQTNDNGYIIAGFTGSFSDESADVYLIKTDVNGDTLWTKSYGGEYDDHGNSIQQTNDNGYIIAGHTYSFGSGNADVYLIKTDVNGDTLWTKTYGGTNEDVGNSVQQTNDNGYIIAGYTESFGAGSTDVYLIKTDVNGDTLWTKTYGGTATDRGYSVRQTNDNGYIIAGFTRSFSDESADVYLIKTDVNGDTLWTKSYGGEHDDYGNSIQQTNDNGYIIAGSTWSFGVGYADVYLIKTDANGNTGINHINVSKDLLKIYPNPVDDILNLEIQNKEKQELLIEIINTNGEIIFKKQHNNTDHIKECIDLSQYASGIYFVKVQYERDLKIGKLVIY